MALNGSGTFTPLYNFVTDRNDGIKIVASRQDEQWEDAAVALSLAIYRDGQGVPTANIPWGGFRITGLGDASAATDAMNRQAGDARWHPKGAVVTTDHAIARYNGALGLTQDSGVIIDDSNNITGAASFATTGSDISARITHTSTDAGANAWNALIFDRFSASPAASDHLASFQFRGRDSLANVTNYAAIGAKIVDTTDTSEDGSLVFSVLVAGAGVDVLTLAEAATFAVPINAGNIVSTGVVTVPQTGLHILDSDGSHDLIISPGSNLSADRTFSIVTGDADRTLTLTGNLAMSGAFNLTHTITGNTNVTYPTTGTLATLAGTEAFSNKSFTGGVSSSTTDTTTDNIKAVSSQNGAATYPALIIDRDSNSPANNDFIGKLIFRGRDAGVAATEYANIDAQILDVTDGSEDGRLILRTIVAGAMVDGIIINGNAAIKGTATNDDAAAGYVGEYVESAVVAGSGVSLTTTVVANITSISLTAGDWDVQALVGWNTSGATDWTLLEGAISLTSATIPSTSLTAEPRISIVKAAGTSGGVATDNISAVPRARIKVASTTTVYLTVQATFTASTVAGYGYISARRVR